MTDLREAELAHRRRSAGMAQAVVPALVLSGIGYFSGALSINQAAIAFTAALVLCSQLLGVGGNAEAEALVGKAAPDVTFTDMATGKTVQVRVWLPHHTHPLWCFAWRGASLPDP